MISISNVSWNVSCMHVYAHARSLLWISGEQFENHCASDLYYYILLPSTRKTAIYLIVRLEGKNGMSTHTSPPLLLFLSEQFTLRTYMFSVKPSFASGLLLWKKSKIFQHCLWLGVNKLGGWLQIKRYTWHHIKISFCNLLVSVYSFTWWSPTLHLWCGSKFKVWRG